MIEYRYRRIRISGGDLVVKYRLDLSDEKKEAAIQIALESERNVRKRKIATPILLILGILEIILAVYFFTNSRFVSGLSFLVIGALIILLAWKTKSFQKFALKKSEILLDKSFRTGIVEYTFDTEGIEVVSQTGYGKNYWSSFKEYGTMGQYIYVKRKDNKLVLVDKNDLSKDETEELMQLLSENIKH